MISARSILQPLVYRYIKWYYRKPRIVRLRNIAFKLMPMVFHPGLYGSTAILLDHILRRHPEDANILELGCGSGYISMYLAKHCPVRVFASDINPQAVEGLKWNAKALRLEIQIFQSDLFKDIPAIPFDYILINPPFFQKEAGSVDEYAFFAGADFEYFQNLFDQIRTRLKENTRVIVILSENANMKKILELAMDFQLKLLEIESQIKWWERFVVFELAM